MLVRVLEIPPPDGKFCFGGGNKQTWLEVDWFRAETDDPYNPGFDTPERRLQVAKFIRQKRYFSPDKAYLVLHPVHPFTINYEAP